MIPTTDHAIMRALGLRWNKPLGDKARAFKWAPREDEIPRQLKVMRDFLPELFTGPRVHLLDVSCGAGVFLEIARYLMHSVHGTEHRCYVDFHADYLDSQGLGWTEHDSNDVPFPFKDASFDVVTCFAAFKQYRPSLRARIFGEFFRMARETVVVRVNHGDFLERGEAAAIFDNPPERWLIEHCDHITWKYMRRDS